MEHHNWKPFTKLISMVMLINLRVIQYTLYTLLLLTPIGIYILWMQFVGKRDRISSIIVQVPEQSEWQYVFNNTILVTTNPGGLPKLIEKKVNEISIKIERNKTFLISLAVLLGLSLLATSTFLIYNGLK